MRRLMASCARGLTVQLHTALPQDRSDPPDRRTPVAHAHHGRRHIADHACRHCPGWNQAALSAQACGGSAWTCCCLARAGRRTKAA